MKYMAKGALAKLLESEVTGGNINACCRILRRIFSETVEDAQPTGFSVGRSALLSDVVALGKASLAADGSHVRSPSVAVLCHVSQRLGDWCSALDFARLLPNLPSPSFLSSLLQPNNCAAVLRFCETRGWALDVPHATRVLAERHGSWTSALDVAEAMERHCGMGERYSLGVLIPYLAASGCWRKAVRMFFDGIAQGSLVDPRFVGDLVYRTVRLKQWQTAFYMLGAIEKTREAADFCPSDENFFRDVITVSPSWRSSLSILHLAIGSGVKPDKSIVSLLLGQCEEANVWLTAIKVYDTAVREGFLSSIEGDSYQTLIRSFHAVKQWEKALVALSWMKKAGESSMTTGMGELLEMCQQSGQWEAAVNIGGVLLEKHEGMPSRTRLALLSACADGAAWQCSIRVLGEYLNDSTSMPHPLLVCATLQACVSAQRWEEALFVFFKAREEEPRLILPPLAHRLVLKACVGSGRWLESMCLLEQMEPRGAPKDNHTHRLGLWAAALSGNWQLSLYQLHRIPRANRTAQDQLIVRSSIQNVSAVARAITLRHLQPHLS
ncbi:hypothetical protein, conserved [Trypanosoma brucei gambiense DAL972]|uniref:Uncharacterized protein n=1 Tax=Trypanosoma brucei gambiense (strain MHOM/CI/86/DAL972) TaxID=679716 RepID=C9ZR90_TRYB9|nr:hypothetical protein, conserved [Trypanosoma brucei gambiense DAL972]CBH11920.1 hypothetical protein, conserved [Trypanosoma brucei gambiense DAL972]|eukprot:XP_011774205.1 hypothetical protein, conserved [Trypanosoma brucei gambiense DAL972]